MSTFKKLSTRIYQKNSTASITPDNVYWKKLKTPVLVKEFGPVDYIDFSPIEPYHFAVTCSVRVQVYNPITKLVVKNLSRFRENAYGATFRSDGRLLCAGSEEKNVKLFDVNSKSLLRLFSGHTAPVHRTFFVHDRQQIASFADDKTVKLWDIPTEKEIITYEEHQDYVRAGATNPIVPDVIVSGGYDNIIKMYDTRTNKIALTLDHGAPVESMLFLPSGSIFLSAGGTHINIWDTIAGGKLLGCISQHHKIVTCLRLASDNKRLLSGSLDRHVKIYDVNSFQVVHTLDFPNSVLSLGISKNDDTVVAGLVDGLVSISRREDGGKQLNKEKKVPFTYMQNVHYNSVDAVVQEKRGKKQAKHDLYLRKFQYRKALDWVLRSFVINKHPEITVAVIQELIRRKSLNKAIQGRDSKFLQTLITFFKKYLTDTRFTRTIIMAVNIFIDTYESEIHTFKVEVIKPLKDLLQTLEEEIKLQNQLASLSGAFSMILAGASAAEQQTNINKYKPHNLVPSDDARKNIIVNLT